MKVFHLSLLSKCNENCLFCAKGPDPEGGKKQFSLKKVLILLREALGKGYEEACLDGGEPTLRPDLPEIIKGAIDAGYKKVTVMTNAVVLSDMEKVRGIVLAHEDARKRVSFCVSLHSHKEGISEKLTGSRNTFSRTLKGMENLIEAGFKTDVYHVITAWSYKDLPAYAEFIAGKKHIREVTFSYIYPVRHIFKNMYLYPKHSAAQPYFKKALRVLKKAKIGVSLSNCSVVPFCLIKDAEKLYVEAYREDLDALACDTSKVEKTPFFVKDLDSNNREKYECCRACVMDKVCGGIWKFYAIIHGTDEIAPYKGTLLKKMFAKITVKA